VRAEWHLRLHFLHPSICGADHPAISFSNACCGVESVGAMTVKFKIGLRIALIRTVVFGGIVAHGQTAQATPNNDALVVSLKMQTEPIQVGQKPWVPRGRWWRSPN
jgi:hypothetical protein